MLAADKPMLRDGKQMSQNLIISHNSSSCGKNMKKKLPIAILALIVVIMLGARSNLSPALAYAGASVYIDPPTRTSHDDGLAIGDELIYLLNYANMTNLAGIEYKLFWNSSLLRVLSVHDTLPWSGAPFVAANETDNDFNVTANLGRMYFVVASMSGPATLNSTTFRTIVFNVTALPPQTEIGALFNTTIYWGTYGTDTIFGDSVGDAIPATAYNSTWVFIHVIPEFTPLVGLVAFALGTVIAVVVYRKKR